MLECLGFAKIRQSGSHVIMRRGSKGCVVPMHSEVKVGTLAGVLRQADISPDEFIALIYRLTNSSRPCDSDAQPDSQLGRAKSGPPVTSTLSTE